MKIPSLHVSIRYGTRIKPSRDWMFLVGLSGILLLLSASWSFWLFEQVVSGQVLGDRVVSAPSVPSAMSLDQIETIFTARAIEGEKYRSAADHFIDPSK